MVWLIIWFVSMGALGFWFLSCVTSRDMNTLASMVCEGVRTAEARVASPRPLPAGMRSAESS